MLELPVGDPIGRPRGTSPDPENCKVCLLCSGGNSFFATAKVWRRVKTPLCYATVSEGLPISYEHRPHRLHQSLPDFGDRQGLGSSSLGVVKSEIKRCVYQK